MADVTVASTTDDQSAVNAAAGLSPEGQETEQAQPGEQETLTTVQEATERPEGEEQEQQEVEGEEHEEVEQEQQVRRPKNAVQKRIDKLTAKNYALEETNAELEARLARLEQAVNRTPDTKTQATSTEPQFAKPRPVQADPKFKDYDEFIEALIEWSGEKKDWERAQAEAKSTQDAMQQRTKQTFDAYNKAVSSARASHEDFDEVVGRDDIQLPYSVMNAIIAMRDRGPEISYQICQDEELCSHLSDIAAEHGDAVALTEFGRWMASTEQEPVVAGGVQEEEERQPVARRSNAPRPIKPVGASSTRSQLSMDELPFRDYRRLRDEAEKSRFRH